MLLPFLAALKNDDADDSDEEREAGDDTEAKLIQREKRDAKATAKANALERQPTGRVVGPIKRNWRA